MTLTKKAKKKVAQMAYESDPKMKEKGVTSKQFLTMIEVLEKYLSGELSKEEMRRLQVITDPSYKQYTVKDLELLQRIHPDLFGSIQLPKKE